MRKNSLLYTALVFALILHGLNLIALELHFYWLYWWFDIFMHFFAGFIGGLATYWVLFNSGLFGSKGQPSFKSKMLIVLFFVMLIGFLWEWLEYAYGITNSHEGYPIDPLFDLVLDGAGALLATYISFKKAHG